MGYFDAIRLFCVVRFVYLGTQKATETRHCNFLCSYGVSKEALTELAAITDESIMIAGGVVKNIDFELADVSSAEGKLVLRLQLYKGSSNNGCFYGLTGVVLKGKREVPTLVDHVGTATVSNGKLFDLAGREVVNPSKGIYIMNGAKRLFK